MLHFIQFLEFLVGLVGSCQSNYLLTLTLKSWLSPWYSILTSVLEAGRSQTSFFLLLFLRSYLVLILKFQGAFGVFVVIVSHFVLHGAARPVAPVLLFHILAMGFAIATFVYCFLNFPYTECKNAGSGGCNVEKAAVPMDGVLMYKSSFELLLTLGDCFSFLLLFSFTTLCTGAVLELAGESVVRGTIIELLFLREMHMPN